MFQHYSRLIATSLVIALVAVASALAQTINGGDYGGADLDPADGAVLNGTFTNVGTFRVQAGRTVYITPGTVLSVSAATADIAGTIDGVGSGYSGGSTSGFSSAGGSGAGPGGGAGGGFGACVHSSGGAGGGYAANGGDGGSYFGSSPSPSTGGSAYGTATGSDIAAGSGGGAAGSFCQDPLYGFPGAGGNGGAGIEIITTGALDVSGAIIVDGAPGAAGTDAEYAGAGGGGGAGGGIRLVGTSGTITGTLSADGGAGGNSGNSLWGDYGQPGGGGSGGRIKIDVALCTSTATISNCGGPAGIHGTMNTSAVPPTAGGTGSLSGGTGCDGNPAGVPVTCGLAVIDLTSPVGESCYAAGQTITIAWTSSDVTQVRIDTSGDGGATYGTLATVDASTGSYEWTIPTTQTVGSLSRVRVSSVEDPAVESESGDFTITAPVVADFAAAPEFLWSPNPDMLDVDVTGAVTGGCGPTVSLVEITASEEGFGVDITNDVAGADYGTDDRSFALRSTVTDGRRGRVYRIVYRIDDASGFSTTEVVWVPVLPAWTRAFHGPEIASERVSIGAPSETPLVTTTDITYTLTMSCATRLWVESLAGDRIIVLSPEQLQTAGTYTVTWDGRDAQGNLLPNGAYLYQLKACGEKRVGVIIIERAS